MDENQPVGAGGRRHQRPEGRNQRNDPFRGGPARNEQQRPEFPGAYQILRDWRLIVGLLGEMIVQREAICWAVVLARLVEAAHNISVRNPLSFLRLSIDDLVAKIKEKTEEKDISSFKKAIKVIRSQGIAKVPTTRPTRNVGRNLTKQIQWRIDSQEAADRHFIENKLEHSPVGIVIDIDDEFDALREGFYRIRAVPPNPSGRISRHALMIMGSGRTTDGQHFFIAQNSWEKSWGVNGYGRLILDDHARCFAFYPLV